MKILKNNKYLKLSPNKSDGFDRYLSALKSAMKDKTVLNIGITGDYGTGKSTIIETYKSKNRHKKFISISVSKFNVEKTVEAFLEKDIITQLASQVKSKKILKSSLQMKENKSNFRLFIYIFFAFRILDILLYNVYSFNLVSINNINTLVNSGFITPTITTHTLIAFNLLFLFSILFIIYDLVRLLVDRKPFKVLNLGPAKTELNVDEIENYFDKYMSDIVYILNNCGADAVVFEDIDRYDNSEIFKKLRNINSVVNSNKTYFWFFKRKPLKFIYLIRDDIFLTKNRTKFFDFIISLAPIITSYNTEEFLLDQLDKIGCSEEFTHSNLLILNVSKNLDDIRVIKNIVNEYKMFKLTIFDNIQKETEIEDIHDYCNSIFALVAYKNVFNWDYPHYIKNYGFLHDFINNKPFAIEATMYILIKSHKNLLNELSKNNFDLKRYLTVIELDLNLKNNYNAYDVLLDASESETSTLKKYSIAENSLQINKFLTTYINYYFKTDTSFDIQHCGLKQLILDIAYDKTYNSSKVILEEKEEKEKEKEKNLIKFLVEWDYLTNSTIDLLSKKPLTDSVSVYHQYIDDVANGKNVWLNKIDTTELNTLKYFIYNNIDVTSYMSVRIMDILLIDDSFYTSKIDTFFKDMHTSYNYSFVSFYLLQGKKIPLFLKHFYNDEAYRTRAISTFSLSPEFNEQFILSLVNIFYKNNFDILNDILSNKDNFELFHEHIIIFLSDENNYSVIPTNTFKNIIDFIYDFNLYVFDEYPCLLRQNVHYNIYKYFIYTKELFTLKGYDGTYNYFVDENIININRELLITLYSFITNTTQSKVPKLINLENKYSELYNVIIKNIQNYIYLFYENSDDYFNLLEKEELKLIIIALNKLDKELFKPHAFINYFKHIDDDLITTTSTILEDNDKQFFRELVFETKARIAYDKDKHNREIAEYMLQYNVDKNTAIEALYGDNDDYPSIYDQIDLDSERKSKATAIEQTNKLFLDSDQNE